MRLISPDVTEAVRYSIVVPPYDEELLLGACLDSLLAQDADVTAEIIVVDNASLDTTAAIARGRGVIVLSEPTRGVCAARQTGTDAARGQYIVSVDADTTYEPGFLSRIDDSFCERPELVAVAGRPHWVAAPWWGRAYESLIFGLIAAAYRLTGWVP